MIHVTNLDRNCRKHLATDYVLSRNRRRPYLFVTVHGHCRSILRIESVRRRKVLQLFPCCPRMNLLWFTLTTWKVERHSVLRTKALNGYLILYLQRDRTCRRTCRDTRLTVSNRKFPAKINDPVVSHHHTPSNAQLVFLDPD